ncbi:hypothetical protein H9Q13_02185 [Pontibacter sp. JH31]|uniref:DUF748 domain-containing protein n=1 Tax=Pontibacter aquaedesilientis TaxID=2766980 RepID=A0ABR7XCD1_9BACT|nr:hypothetical protein [Pontibacter aquaedesilientis]MBD1395960.1 hypothetical protein [Pontibacter aquaedesilientis]
MSEPATPGKGQKALKIASIVLVSLAGLLLLALLVLFFFAEPLAERYLKKQVAQQTDGLYQLDFDELDLSFSNWGVTLQGVHLYPDTALHHQQKEKGQASPSLLELQSPKLEITGINLRALLFNNRLTVGKVVAEKPEITHWHDAAVTKKSRQGSKGGGGLEALRIRELDLQDASYRYQLLGEQGRPQHDILQLSLQVEGLQLDLQTQEAISQVFQADALDLAIRRYTYRTPDSVYTIRVGRFTYASGQQELKAQHIAVQPNLQANAALPKDQAHRTLYEFSAPLLALQGLDVASAWETKDLQLDQLLLERGTLQLHENLNVPETTESPSLKDRYTQLSPYLRALGIQELRLRNGDFSYLQHGLAVDTIHRLANANLYLQAVQLDSLTLFAPSEKVFAEAVSISTGRYTYNPVSSPYTLQTAGMQLSTRDKSLEAKALHLSGDWDKNDALKSQNLAKHTHYDIQLPQLRFQEMELLEAIRSSRLTIGSIAAEQPVIDVRTDQRVPKSEEGPDLQALYRQVSAIVSSLEVGEIRIRDAALTQHSKNRNIQRLQQLEHASLVAIGLELDSAFVFGPDQVLPLQDLVVTARNYRYRMPDNTYTFTLGGLRYSTRQQEFLAKSLDVNSSLRANNQQKLRNNASRKLIDLSAHSLQITGLDLIRALNTGRLQADRLVLQQPDVAILLDREVTESGAGQREAGKALFERMELISVNTIRLEDGSFTFSEKLRPVMRTHQLEHATATITGFELTPTSFKNLNDTLPMQELNLVATDYTYRSTDSLYTIRLDSLHYSSRQQELVARTLLVNADRGVNERLKENRPELASHNLIDITARRSRISGFNLIHAYATGQYHLDRLLLAGPKVTILQDHDVPANQSMALAEQDTASSNGTRERVEELISTLRVGRLDVTDGSFDFEILRNDTIRSSHALAHVALGIDELRLVSLEKNDPLDIFDVDDIEVLIQGYTYQMPDSLYALEIKEIRASMQRHSLHLDSLHLRPLFSKEDQADESGYARNRTELEVPSLELINANLRNLFNNQDLIAQKMLIRNPRLEVSRDNSIGLDPGRRPPTLQQMLRGADLYIKLDTVVVNKKSLEHAVIAVQASEPAVFRLEDVYMELFNVTNDTALIRQDNIITANVKARLMGASILQGRYTFEMDHPEDRYTYEGTLDPMDLTVLNPLFENMLFIRIRSGQVGKATFSIESTATTSTGQVHFPYSNLKIQLLSKDDPDNPGLLLKVGTRLVNALIVKTNNPSTLGKFREGYVAEERDMQRSVFHHMGQSLFDGVATSLMTKCVERIVSKFVDL